MSVSASTRYMKRSLLASGAPLNEPPDAAALPRTILWRRLSRCLFLLTCSVGIWKLVSVSDGHGSALVLASAQDLTEWVLTLSREPEPLPLAELAALPPRRPPLPLPRPRVVCVDRGGGMMSRSLCVDEAADGCC